MDIISRETSPSLGYNNDDEQHRLLLADEQRMVDIEHPHHNDVLCGRGVTTNRHPGNESFRSLVGLNKEVYVSSSKKEKMEISRSIVAAVRQLDPPGRFLEKDPNTGLWSDIGPKKAVEKTSQALRDGAANLRKRLSADLGDPDFLSDVFEIHIHEDGEKPKPKPNASTDSKPQGDETKESTASTKCKKLAEKPKVVKKAKPQHIKKGHRRTLSNPCVGSAGKSSRRSPPVEPPSPMARFGNSSYHHPPLTPQTPVSIHPASHPNSPMTWGAGAPYHERESPRTVGSAPLTYSPYEHSHPSPGVPPPRSYGGPQYHSSPSSHHYYYSPSHEGSGPPYQPHSWSSYGYPAPEHSSEGGHYSYPSRRPPPHHVYPRHHHHHSAMPTPPRPPRSSSPPRSPLPRGPLPPGRHQFSPAGYRGGPQYFESPAHEAPPHSEGSNGESSSWYPRSAPPGSEHTPSWRSPHSHPQYGSPAPSGYPTSCSSSSTSWLSVPSLGSEAKYSARSHLSPRTMLTPRATAFSRTPEWPNPSDQAHFKPPTPSHLMKERYPDMDDSANRASPPGEEKKSEHEKDEFKGHFRHVERSYGGTSPHSHTPTPVKMETHTQDKSPRRESPPALAAGAPGKGSDLAQAGHVPQAEEDYDAMDTPMTPVEDIAMSPIPLDREDPTTLMALPENILSLPISPCGPNDEAQAISA